MLLSIDIGNQKICAVEGQFSGGRLSVARFAALPLREAETVDDGSVKNRLRLATSLSHLFLTGGFGTRRAVLTFNSSFILSRRLELPFSKPKEIAQMARNEMLQIVGNADDYVFDCACVPAQPRRDICPAWAYAVPREMVEGYLAAAQDAGLKPAALDVHANSVEKLFLSLPPAGAGAAPAELMVELQEQGADIHLFSGKERAFSRFSPVSTAELDSLLANAGFTSEKNLPLQGAAFNGEPFLSDAILHEAARRYFAQLAEELQKIIRFQQRRAKDDPVRAIRLYGALAGVGGATDALHEALGLPVHVIDRLPGLFAPDGFVPLEYVNALGALIRLH